MDEGGGHRMAQVPVRFEPHQAEAIRKEADAMGISFAAFVREAAWWRVVMLRLSRGEDYHGKPLP